MTEIIRSIRDRHYKIEIKGHADSDEYGKDLVCCAISTLAFTLLEYLEKESKIGRVLNFTTHFEDGYIKAECDFMYNNVRDAIEAIECGFNLLEKNYKKYIKITPKG